MIPTAAPDDPLEQTAPSPSSGDPVVDRWFLQGAERTNRSSGLRAFSTGNEVTQLVDGGTYFPRLCRELQDTVAGDQIYFLDFCGDMDELLGGPGTAVGGVLAAAAERGVQVFGLLWRSQPSALQQTEEANAELVRLLREHGGQVLLDSRTRRAGSHHQKLVVIRRPQRPHADVAFVGGIDLGHGRHDDRDHHGDPQPIAPFPAEFGALPPWHDIQAEVRGPAVHDLEHTFRERWYGSTPLDVSSPLRQLYDRTYHMGALTSAPLPPPLPEPPAAGTVAVQVLRTYPARLRRYPFAPLGERSIAHAYAKALVRARRLVYLEDQYLWSSQVASVLAAALRAHPDLHVVVVVPRFPDREGRVARPPALAGREQALRMCRAAGGERFAVYDLENDEGTPVYVHAKVVVIDDTWAMIGSDNLNRRSWTHDSELSVALLDDRRDGRDPHDPGGHGDGARRLAREIRLDLLREHLDRDPEDDADLVDPATAFAAVADAARALDAWHSNGHTGPRPPGRLRVNHSEPVQRRDRWWATAVYRLVYDPDGRAIRDRLRRRL